jgi:PAS domain S-box-containing protein
MYSQVIVLFAAFCSSITIIAIAIGVRKNPGAISMMLFGGSLFALALIYSAIQVLNLYEDLPLIILNIGIVLACTALLSFSIEYSNPRIWLPRLYIPVVSLIPAFSLLLGWILLTQGVFGFERFPGEIEPILQLLTTLFLVPVLLVATIVMAQMLVNTSPSYKPQYTMTMIGMILPIISAGLSIFGVPIILGVRVHIITLSMTGLVLSYALIKYRLLRIIPISRSDIVEVSKDGWLFVDSSDHIADLNYAAGKVIGLPRAKILGQKIDSILQNWGNFAKNVSAKELEFRGSINIDGQWKYFNIRSSSITDRVGKLIGQVITWRDITERRKADAARQQTRDEMFVLLQSIADAASRSLRLSDFLLESINHIVYSFNSTISMVFMLDEKFEKENYDSYHLAASHGLSEKFFTRITAMFNEHQNTGIFENLEPFLIDDTGMDERIPEAFHLLGNLSLFGSPMIAENEYIGWALLARPSDSPFGSDEFARLKIVIEELSTRIFNFRRFQTKVAVEERQRLVRDLHDAVSQKLYGLVTLTEGTKARIAAGQPDIPDEVLTKIGENARQALKEMRLFLYELQPVDLEQGLVAALHYRLGAVEGRADVKARLLADEDIQLGPEKQLALYYISQEALNNILRHAGAKSVVVRLQQKRVNVIFEIEDDGCGFNVKQSSTSAGLGLKNMRERTALIGGKCKIHSVPGKGTKITVTVSKDSKPKRRRP